MPIAYTPRLYDQNKTINSSKKRKKKIKLEKAEKGEQSQICSKAQFYFRI